MDPLSDIDFEMKKAEKEEEETQRRKIIKGYPMTRTPFVPEILLEHAIDFKTMECEFGYQKIGLTLAAGGSNLVNSESLEMIQGELISKFEYFPEISEKFENELPRNIIAISFTEPNFEVGKSCQDFSPCSRFKIPEDAYFTYQRLSENLQATFYNENGVEFLAGICYYPVPNDKVMLLKNDKALITLSTQSSEPFPLQNRETNYRNHKFYGRYCETAGKRVAIDCSGNRGRICHIEYNHALDSWNYPQCDECAVDYLTYKWKEPKKTASPAPVPIVTYASSKLEQPKKSTSPDPTVQSPTKQEQPIETPKVITPASGATIASGKLENPNKSAPANSNAPTSPSTTKKSEASTTGASSKSLSQASSTESLLKEFDNIKTNDVFDEEFDAKTNN